MNLSTRGRARYSGEERAALVREFRSSGKTQKDFAVRHGVKWTTFRNWLYGGRTAAPKRQRPISFQEIRITPAASPNGWAAEISLDSGAVVRLAAGADPRWAQAIIQPLRQPC
jgi:hypothetical protein